MGAGTGRQTGPVDITVRHIASSEIVVQVTGELCGDSGAVLRRVAAHELTQSPSPLALDLSEVKRIDVSGIDALVSAAELAAESDISLRLVGAHAGPVAAALAAAQLTEMFEIVASIDECEPIPDAHTDVERRTST